MAPEALEPPVTWRNGVHISGTSIWCDARRARDLCFVSCADAVTRARHGQYVATETTLALIGRHAESGASGPHLAVPYGRPFTLGTTRIELFRSGRGPGAASLLVSRGQRRIVYAGVVNSTGGMLTEGADVRSCDALVVATSYGHPRYAFSPIEQVEGELIEHCQTTIGRGGAIAILVRAPLKGIEVATRLAHAGLAVWAQRSIHHAAQRLRGCGLDLPRLRRFGGSSAAGQVILWLCADRDRLDAIDLPSGSSTVLVSGRALDADYCTALAVERGFAWSDQADYRTLIQYVTDTRAEEVYVLGSAGEELITSLVAQGRRAHRLGPPQQLMLFREPTASA